RPRTPPLLAPRERRRLDERSRTTSRRTSAASRAPGVAFASWPPNRGRRAACREPPVRRWGSRRGACARPASSAPLRPPGHRTQARVAYYVRKRTLARAAPVRVKVTRNEPGRRYVSPSASQGRLAFVG